LCYEDENVAADKIVLILPVPSEKNHLVISVHAKVVRGREPGVG
jgi:hypothetical protein